MPATAARNWCSPHADGFRLAVQIQANARKSEVIAVLDDALKIKLHAQPIDGKANLALIAYLATLLKLPKNAVSITHGHTAKRKLLAIAAPHLTLEQFEQALLAGLGA
jgi:uncharacterized protein (TIGR00251 family)